MVSIILPTIRPNNINLTINSLLLSSFRLFEILVIADFDAPFHLDHRVKWIKQERMGPIAAINEGHKQAQGDFFFLTNDESEISHHGLEILEDALKDNPIQILTPKHIPYFPFYYYKKFFAPFPFVSRETLKVLCNDAYFFDPQYKGFYADPDLSLRAHELGIPVTECYDVRLSHNNDMYAIGHKENVNTFLLHDRKIFCARWNHLGEFKDPGGVEH